MTKCKYCGDEHGMSWGTGDCGCQEEFDVGMGDLGDGSDQNRAEEWWKNYSSRPIKKVEITLEGPGNEGLSTAESMLFMAGYPPTDPSVTSGSYTDLELMVSIRWRMM